MPDWKPSSWRSFPAAQQPIYDDPPRVDTVAARIQKMPPLVTIGEIENLQAQLKEAALGKRFILQGGDCAEQFHDCNSAQIVRKLKILLQMSLVLTYGARKPVIRVGRIAGQFAKPRSSDKETVNGLEMSSYRGDNVNALQADPQLRRPDPDRLLQGYYTSATTLNYIRGLLKGGFANLREPEHWQLDFIPHDSDDAGYREIADRIRDAIDYFDSLGGQIGEFLREVDFFSSHEGLLLPYEEALTRPSTRSPRFYNLGAHTLWIGERTRQLDGAHVEYFRGLANPIGVKVGPSVSPDDLLRLCDRLDPERELGRLTLITRFGAERIAPFLPPLLRAMVREGRRVIWSCDPMHGNTIATPSGVKTRDFGKISEELQSAFLIHRAEGTVLAGVHFELTGENVTECVGGAVGLQSADLLRSYETGCDPRLNYSQSMEIAFLISALLHRDKVTGKAGEDW